MNNASRPFSAAKATAIGARDSNQDRGFFFHDGSTLLLGVADGLGGHPRGEVAAQLLADVCESQFRHGTRPLPDPEDFMIDCIGRAHRAIRRFGERQVPPIAPRTTAVLAVIQDGIAYWAHVGDSRLYLIRNGGMQLHTRDHAQTQYIRHSADEPPRARTSLTRCLGGLLQPPMTTCSRPLPLQEGDSLLLCSDGLWGQVSQQMLAAIFDGDATSLEARLPGLIEKAAAAAGSDNVTAVALTWLQPTTTAHADIVMPMPDQPPHTDHHPDNKD